MKGWKHMLLPTAVQQKRWGICCIMSLHRIVSCCWDMVLTKDYSSVRMTARRDLTKSSWGIPSLFIFGSMEATWWLYGAILREITRALLQHRGESAVDILGDIDAVKVRSCMTLFDAVSSDVIDVGLLLPLYYHKRNEANMGRLW